MQPFPLSHLGLIKVAGPDAKKLLQGQLTTDLNTLNTGESGLSAQCNPRGRVISLFRLFHMSDYYYLQMPKALLIKALSALKKYAPFYKVTLTIENNDIMQLGYIGENLNPNQMPPHFTFFPLPHSPTRYILLGEFCKVDNIKNSNNIENNETARNSLLQWKTLDIQNGLVSLYPETSETFLPHDINLIQENAVSFTKGCYTGQEIIARMQYLGKQKNQLLYAEIQTPLPLTRGHDIYSDEVKVIGTLVDFHQATSTFYHVLIIAPLTLPQKIYLDVECTAAFSLPNHPLKG